MNRLLTVAITAWTAIAGLASAAQAEVLAIEGLSPANEPEFAEIRSLTIDGFGGRDGRALSFQLEERLAAVSIFGQPYFDLIGARSAVDADASLSGSVSSSVNERDTVAKRRRCVERDEKDKCITHKDIEVKCRTRVIDFQAQVRATRFADGRSIYVKSIPDRNEQTLCVGDDKEFPSSDSVIRSMIGETANAIRDDLAPRQYRQDIRILENRKGMSKPDENLFKAAIHMTKTDPQEACRMWDESARNGLVHLSLLFNLGLCAEQRGELDAALGLYRDSDRLSPGKLEVTQSIQRTSDHRRALDEWELHRSARR